MAIVLEKLQYDWQDSLKLRGQGQELGIEVKGLLGVPVPHGRVLGLES